MWLLTKIQFYQNHLILDVTVIKNAYYNAWSFSIVHALFYFRIKRLASSMKTGC